MGDSKRILLVDDEPDFVAVVRANLERVGYTVEVAHSGAEGLKKVHASPPDAIVLDVMMPEPDGYKVCAELKADKKYAHIPILLLTAVASNVPSTRYSHFNGMSMEADDYLPKPASAEQIGESLARLLGRKR